MPIEKQKLMSNLLKEAKELLEKAKREVEQFIERSSN